MTTPASGPSSEADASPTYYISFDRVASFGRSAVAVLAARRAPMSPSMVQADHELDDPQALVDEIAEFGPQEEDFIRSDMPIKEIVFRILLAHGNRPTPLQEIHEELTGKWSTSIRPINVTESSLARILDQDNYYGFSRDDPSAAS